MAHNRSPLSRGSAEFWNQIAGHMLSAHRRAMQKTRGIRRIRERKMNSKTIKLTILTSIGEIALTGCGTDPVTGERKISKAAIGGVGSAHGGNLPGDRNGGNSSDGRRGGKTGGRRG